MFKILLVILVAAPAIGLALLLYTFSSEYVKKLNRREERAMKQAEQESGYRWDRAPESNVYRGYETPEYKSFKAPEYRGYEVPEYRGIGTGLDDYYNSKH